MSTWLLVVLISTRYVTTAPVYPQFMSKAACEQTLAALKKLEHSDIEVNGSCVEIK